MRSPVLAVLSVVMLMAGWAESASGARMTTRQQKTVGGYRLLLVVGPAQHMSMSGSTGELILGGKNATCHMTGGKGMSGMVAEAQRSTTTTCNSHVELHVYLTKNGHVVTNAGVSITMKDMMSHATIVVPIMRMRGAKASMNDMHYGNNVYTKSGTYAVSVRVNTVRTTFSVDVM